MDAELRRLECLKLAYASHKGPSDTTVVERAAEIERLVTEDDGLQTAAREALLAREQHRKRMIEKVDAMRAAGQSVMSEMAMLVEVWREQYGVGGEDSH